MPHIHTEQWSLEVPDDWFIDYDESEGLVSISDPDEIGSLDLRIMEKESGTPEAGDLLNLANASTADADGVLKDIEPVKVGQFSGQTVAFVEDEVYWREWYLLGDGFVLLITYNADFVNWGLDDAIIEDILDTLVRELPEDG